MKRTDKYNYGKAESDLYDSGAYDPEEIYDHRSESSFRSHMKEHGLNPDRYANSGSRKKSSGSKKGGGCYLTTACAVSRGLPDDCEELETLRAFRDSYLASLANGHSEIELYYEMAPKIVSAIDRRNDRVRIWDTVYEELIAPCVSMIRKQDNESAYRLYKSYSLQLHERYCM